ncbi:MAG: TIM barrel protein [Phaeovulum sp.]|uniref:sugar phosphate isomerase/epimerase family protein n=1 Tax=Phaeovulum sp. TaxID=2934796 RepID=UPI0027330227|nr:TIM barrel protein [Phaeovulum sp.]MDP3860618.1 TIM barrel protein [Phaeovulum sp.]
MNRPISLAYLTVPGLTPVEQTQVAAEAGYDYVSFRLINLGVPGEPAADPLSPMMLRRARAALAETGLKAHDIELARILREVDPQSFLPAFEAGAELGARHVIASAWTSVRNDRDFVVERFCEICDLAAPFGLTINLEFPAFSRLASLEDAVEVLDLASRANAGLLIDTLYWHFSHARLADLRSVRREWINFLHICDAPAEIPGTREEMLHIAREARLYPGEGAIDFAALAAALPKVPLSIELPNARRSAELGHLGHARRCLEAAHRIFDRQGLAPSPRTGTAG